MGLFSGRKSNHRRLDSADQDNEVASHESSGMQAVVVNVTVPEGAEFGAEFSSDNHIISIAKDSICFKTQLKEGDLVVQAITCLIPAPPITRPEVGEWRSPHNPPPLLSTQTAYLGSPTCAHHPRSTALGQRRRRWPT